MVDDICICVPLPSTMQQGAMCTYLKYIIDKYGYHNANIAHIANMLNKHKHPTFLHQYAKTQPTVAYTSHVISKYVLETNIPPDWGYLRAIYGECAYVCYL